MLEMEKAAEVIASERKGSHFNLKSFRTETEITGFLHLLNGGWMNAGEYNGTFVPTEEFWKHIK